MDSVTSSKVFDATSVFFSAKQSASVESLVKQTSPETFQPKDLEKIIEQISQIDAKHLPTEMRAEFQTLCGRVHTLNVNHVIDAIYEEADALRQGHYFSPHELASRVQVLKEMMADVWHSNALTPENSNYLRIASMYLNEVTQQTSDKKIGDMLHHEHIKPIRGDEMDIESQVIGTSVEPTWDDAELSIDILETAQMLFQKNPEGELKFRALPNDTQEALGPLDRSPDYIQNMVAFAMQMARNDGYVPSMEEIEVMFAEAPLDS